MSSFPKTFGPVWPVSAGLGASLVAAAALAVAVVAIVDHAFAPADLFAARSLACFAALALCIAVFALRHLERGRFGVANFVTLLRAALIAPLFGLLFEAPTAALGWLAIVLAVIGLVLDGVDGRLARRFGRASAFGARFDMEVDALLILVLSALCWQFDKAGAWILAAGLLRYAFVAAGIVLPRMRRPLPPSRRRQTVCVVQIVALLICLAPFLTRPASVAAGALGLAILAWSFVVDTVWLCRRS